MPTPNAGCACNARLQRGHAMLDPASTVLLDVSHVSQTFAKGSGEIGAPVLQDVSMSLKTGEIVGAARPFRLRQVDAAAHHLRAGAPDRGKGHDRRQAGRRPRGKRRDGVPELRAVPLAHRARQRRDRPAGARRSARRNAQARLAGDRRHRPRRLRIRLSQGAFRRHAPARRLCPRAGRAAANPA